MAVNPLDFDFFMPPETSEKFPIFNFNNDYNDNLSNDINFNNQLNHLNNLSLPIQLPPQLPQPIQFNQANQQSHVYNYIPDVNIWNVGAKFINIHSIKSFTKLCNLSTPTVMKWLDGHQVYKSSASKINKALEMSRITKNDLLKMRRAFKNAKKFKSITPENNIMVDNTTTQACEKQMQRAEDIEFIVGHIWSNKTDANPIFETHLMYQVVYSDLSTGWLESTKFVSEKETKMIVTYWESLHE